MNKIVPKRSELVNPFASMFEEIVDRFFDDDAFGFDRPVKLLDGMRHKAYPKVNIYQKAGNFVVEAAVPGMTKKDVKVHLEDNFLTISGKTEKAQDVEEDNYFYKELTSSAFSRSIQLPSDLPKDSVEKLKARLDNGILKIEIPYPEKPTTAKEIQIEEAEVK